MKPRNFHSLFLTANSAVAETPTELVFACASTANALPEQLADGWHVLSPFGEFPSPDGRYVQVFGRAQADAMVRSWNSIAGRFGRLMKNAVHRRTASMSLPIYDAPPGAAHPDLEPLREVKTPIIGEATELRSSNAGLEGFVKWTEAARAGDRQPGPLYPSSNWWHERADASGRVYPEHIESVTLTRTPNIRTVPAWTANSADEARDEHGRWTEKLGAIAEVKSGEHSAQPGRYVRKASGVGEYTQWHSEDRPNAMPLTNAHMKRLHDAGHVELRTANTLAGIPLAHNQTANTDPMNQEQLNTLRKSLGLPETADPAACIQAATTANAALATLAERDAALNTANSTVTTLNTERDTLRTQHGSLTTERDSLKGERDTLQTANTALAAEVATLRKGLLDLAQERGAITPAERESFETRLSTANTIADALKELPARKAMNTQHVELNGTRHDLSTANARMDALETAVKTRMAADKCDRDTAYGRVKADKNFAGLFAAMQDPAKAKA